MKKFVVPIQKKVALFIALCVCCFFLYSFQLIKESKYNFLIDDTPKIINLRDFYGYECKNMMRMGGSEAAVKNAPNPLWRIDGAWFICLDASLNMEKNKKCNVLSFGINYDYSFDLHFIEKFGCTHINFQTISNFRS